MKIYIINEKTCTRVKLFGEDVKNTFIANNCEIVKDRIQADYIFINTCSFLKSKEEYFVKFISGIYNQKALNQTLVIFGCLPSVNKQAIENIGQDILMFGRDLDKIKEHFNLQNSAKTKVCQVKDKLPFKKKVLYYFNKIFLHSKHIEYRLKRNKVCYLQISTGCRGNCSYCSEKFTTKLKSRSVEEIIKAIYDGLDRGFKLFALNSDDASAYGKDIGESLENLLEKVVTIPKKFHIAIPEFNPQGLTAKVLECLKDKKFLYITVPIQSGSQKILDKMNRPYKIDEVVEKIKVLRKNNKKLKINTHIIVGFPDETEEDFIMTKNIISSGLFDRVKVFKYSERPNTLASTFENKVDESVKEFRQKEILKAIKKANKKKFSLTNLILNKEQLK